MVVSSGLTVILNGSKKRFSFQIDVGGFMYFWGLTIDIVAATNIIISVGLCVDFAAHLTHTFMKERSDVKSNGTIKAGPFLDQKS
jgi:hypothetical protein